MLIKTADDKRKRIQLLNDLQQSTQLDARQRQWLREELDRLQLGLQGERDAAYYIDNWLKDSSNSAVLHDLRVSVDGEVAQIDHLVLHRTLQIYLFETKCFSGHLQINEHGEFTVRYGNTKAYGIPSPLEQSRRHERVLTRLLERLDITGRAGLKPVFHHAVLLHPKAIIERPKPNAFDTRDVIKADQIASWHERYVNERMGVGATFGMLMNVHSSDTLKSWAEKLARQHRPQDPLALPAFMAPRPAKSAQPATANSVEARAKSEASPQATQSVEDHPLYRKLECVKCHSKISYAEGKFCWNNPRRFGGLQFCRAHQAEAA
ncbi:nuclease-related domain-containing protein [Kinneretia asaccharophila]|uniref:Nuclease-like protein n=1 Tax=Roseateles asaccharophilus TaxID=582607 RepID=A0A4V3CK88_9BURK|nr:nuclease-related domain-containing protein [Roseateles asaccharophilus]MDN3543304.1 nuclease-related domain-containing protein [Roseateles asaccharophilus]TDP12997.1 nuclease-like protein [Roseateles asaccharophilus]